jgi:hypothetical protein
MIPREHGVWAVLFAAFLAGLGVAGRVGIPVLLLFLAITALVCLTAPLGLLIRRGQGDGQAAERGRAGRWLAVHGVVALAAGLPLILAYEMRFLLGFAAAGAGFLLLRVLLVRGQTDRTLAGELAGTAGLALVGPATHAVARGGVESAGLILWPCLTLFFASGVFYVRMRIRGMRAARRGETGPLPALRECVVYHGALLAGLPLLAAAGVISWPVLLAFAPALWRAAAGVRRRAAPLDLRRLGWSEVALTAVFLVLFVLTY